jgi:hypothetical protein
LHPAAAPGILHAMKRRQRLPVLFTMLVIVFLLLPFVDEKRRFGAILMEGIFSLVLIGGIYAESGRRRTLVVGLWLTLPALGISWAGTITGVVGLNIAGAVLYDLALAYLLYVLVRDLWRTDEVTIHTLNVAVSGYLVLGIFWVFLYQFLLLLDPTSFRGIEPGPGSMSAVLYFSFTTLTTLGYGDIAPVSRAARSLATLEAVLGQIYIAVMVARLVGLYIVGATRKKNDD